MLKWLMMTFLALALSGCGYNTLQSTDEDIQAALDLAGAWSDLDWDDMEAELYRIGHSTPPSPPIEFDFEDNPETDAT